MKFQVAWILLVMLRTKFKNENEQRAIPPKVWCLKLWFLCTALLLNEIYLPMKFHVDALHSFKVMLRTKFNNENEQRAITPKVWSFEFWFLCTALLLNEIYLPMKFQVSSLNTRLSYALDKILEWKWTNGNSSKSMMPRVMVLVHCTSPKWDLSTYEVSCWCLADLRLCSGQNSIMKMNKVQ